MGSKGQQGNPRGLDGLLDRVSQPWFVFILLALFWCMAVSAQLEKSATFDETAHLTGGYSYWVTQDFRLQPENGNLSQRWVALPLLFSHYRFPSLYQPAWVEASLWDVGYLFFYRMHNDVREMLLSGRAMMALMAVGLGVLVYAWSRTLFGPLGGLISLLLFAFSPSMLAHGSLMTSDLPVTLFVSAAVWSIWTMMQRLTIGTVVVSAAAIAAALLSKLSGLVVLPIAVLLLVIRLASRRPLRVSLFGEFYVRAPMQQLAVLGVAIMIQAVVVLAVLWSFYDFRYPAFGPVRNEGDQFIKPWEMVLTGTGRWTPVIEFARDHHLLPEAYLYGLSFMIGHTAARRAFLNGEYRMEGWWYFFPYCLLVKSPLPLFVLLASAAAGAAAMCRASPGSSRPSAPEPVGDRLYATSPLWVLLGVYWLFAVASHLNIGERYILPTYPPMFVLAGATAFWFYLPSRALKGVVLASVAWFMLESVSVRPHYLAYFNQIAGGPAQAYRHLVDSSLDWGQDLPGLKRWLDRHGFTDPERTPVYLAYFGSGSPAYYGIKARALPGQWYEGRSPIEEALKPLTGGVYCISATTLQTPPIRYWGSWTEAYERMYRTLLADVEQYKEAKRDPERWQQRLAESEPEFWDNRLEMFGDLRFSRLLAYLRERNPDEQVGHSILIYRLTDEQLRQAIYGPIPMR